MDSKTIQKHFKMLEVYLSKKDIEVVKSYYCVYSETRSKNPLVTSFFNTYGSLGTDLLLGKEGKSNAMYRKMVKTFGQFTYEKSKKRSIILNVP